MAGPAQGAAGGWDTGHHLLVAHGADVFQALAGHIADEVGDGAAVEAGCDNAHMAVLVKGVGPLDDDGVGVVILEGLVNLLIHRLALVKHVGETLAAGGLGDAQQAVGAVAHSTQAGFHLIAQLLGDKGVGGAASQQDIGVLPGLLELGHLDDRLGNQAAGLSGGQNKGSFHDDYSNLISFLTRFADEDIHLHRKNV